MTNLELNIMIGHINGWKRFPKDSGGGGRYWFTKGSVFEHRIDIDHYSPSTDIRHMEDLMRSYYISSRFEYGSFTVSSDGGTPIIETSFCRAVCMAIVVSKIGLENLNKFKGITFCMDLEKRLSVFGILPKWKRA